MAEFAIELEIEEIFIGSIGNEKPVIHEPILSGSLSELDIFDFLVFTKNGIADRLVSRNSYGLEIDLFEELLEDFSVGFPVLFYPLNCGNFAEIPLGARYPTPFDTLTIIDFDENEPDIVDFFATPQIGNVPLSVQFFNLSDIYSNLTSIKWDFGDGTFSSLNNPIHVFRTPGYFNISLIINNKIINTKPRYIYVKPKIQNYPFKSGKCFSVEITEKDFENLKTYNPVTDLQNYYKSIKNEFEFNLDKYFLDQTKNDNNQ